MVCFDEKRRGLLIAINNAEEVLRDAKLDLLCYDHRDTMREHKLVRGKNYHFSPPLDVLVSRGPIERCVFDGRKLGRCSAMISETAVYQCPRCKMHYECPPTKETKREMARSQKPYAKRS